MQIFDVVGKIAIHVEQPTLLTQQRQINYLLELNLQGLETILLQSKMGNNKEDMLYNKWGACGNGITLKLKLHR
jgi:hypothetical protein